MKSFTCLVLLSIIACAVTSDTRSQDQYLEKPCGSSAPLEIDCVRRYFVSKAECAVVTNADSEPVQRDRLFFFIPSIKLTVIDHNIQLRNLNGTIQKFYFNKLSDNLVMSVYFKNITYQSPRSHFHFTRVEGDLEPFRVTDFIKASYPFLVTAVIPFENGKITNASVKEAMVISNFPAPAEVNIGPKITGSSDPDVQRTLAAFMQNVPNTLREIFLTEGPSHFEAYLQKHICDFGIPLGN